MALLRTLPRGPWWAFALGLLVFFTGVTAAGLLLSPGRSPDRLLASFYSAELAVFDAPSVDGV